MFMYDIHCHIIPGVDDGADSMSETIEMLNIAASNLTQGIICTPHSNIPDSFENYWSDELESRFKAIEEEIAKRQLPIKIFRGHEVFLAGDVSEHLKKRELRTLNNSKYVLVELYPFEKEYYAYKKLAALVAEGYVPIVAHPERYAFVIENPEVIVNIKDLGCLIQLNKGSLKGRFGDVVKYAAHRVLDERKADFVASDAHSPYKRTTNLTDVHEMISTEYSLDYADYLLRSNPLDVICNKNIFRY